MTKPAAKRIVIVGAGPAGLLTAILLMRRNSNSADADNSSKFHVTLIDPGVDHGRLDAQELRRVRSWMIGLSCHGLLAIRSVPGLYGYVEALGTEIRSATAAFSRLVQFTYDVTEEERRANPLIGFAVDRNYVCAALSRYLRERVLNLDPNDRTAESESDLFSARYGTKALFVDGEAKTVLVRGSTDGATESIPYDVVIGCDGVRSVVRSAIVGAEREFELQLSGTFGRFKSLHVPRPADCPRYRFYYLFNCPPSSGGVVLPEPDPEQINVAFGYGDNVEVPAELNSGDPSAVADYFRGNFDLFDMDCDAVGREWVKLGWSSTGQVRCNRYHSAKLSALILGDAAHATSPNIGQGMNTALADAKALDELLDRYGEGKGDGEGGGCNWEETILPAFSEERVKEGNALTDLSFHTFSLSPIVQLEIVVRQYARKKLNKVLPRWLYEAEPMGEIARGMKLSAAYDRMAKLGYIGRVRRINDDIMRRHFERRVGMVVDDHASNRKRICYAAVVAGAAAVAGVSFYRRR